RDLRTIAETLAEHGSNSQDAGILSAQVRISLGRQIVQSIFGMVPELTVMTIHPSLEQILLQSVQGHGENVMAFEPGLAQMVHSSLKKASDKQQARGEPSVLLVSQNLRAFLARMVRHAIPELRVLSYDEVPDDKQLRVVANIGMPGQAADGDVRTGNEN
ncbi:MAG: flagellar biosynthesis protein FlhA, partial [Gammaproteobacteria bacterium]